MQLHLLEVEREAVLQFGTRELQGFHQPHHILVSNPPGVARAGMQPHAGAHTWSEHLCTPETNGQSIERTGFRPGSHGIAGGGIYTRGRDAQGTRPRCGAEVQGEAEQSLRHFVPGFTTIKRYDTGHRAHDAEISCDHALQRVCADKHT